MAGRPNYPTTDWELLSLTCSDASVDSREAVHSSIARYLPSIREYFRSDRRVPPQDVDDVAQSFVADQVIRYQLFSKADRSRGRFRKLLGTALYNFVTDSGRSRRPDSSAMPSTLSVGPGEIEPQDAGRDPTLGFDLIWARQTLTLCLARTRAHYQRSDMLAHWEAFERRLIAPAADNQKPPSFKTLAVELGFESPSQASNAVISGRRYFLKQLEAELLSQAGSKTTIKEELAELMKIFSGRAGLRPLPRTDR